MKAIVLAGGGEIAGRQKAFISIAGQPMVRYVTEALKNVKDIDDIFVLLSMECTNQESDDLNVIVGSQNLLENVRIALTHADQDEYVLITSCDMPFLTAAAVTDFIGHCDSGADGYYPIVDRLHMNQFFSGSRRTYVKLRDGTFTGGNLFVVRPSKVLAQMGIIENFLMHRKSPLKLSAMLGWRFTAKLLLSRLMPLMTISNVEKRVCDLLGLQVQAVQTNFPEIAADVDVLSDLEWFGKRMQKSEQLLS